MKQKKAIIYLRVSTEAQDYARQLAELNREAEYRNWNVIRVINDKETGRHDDRSGFVELCSMTKYDVDVIAIWELSRLSRRLITTLQVIDEFSKKGIAIFSKKENILTLDEDGRENPATKLALVLLGQMAETELENIRERTISGKRHALIKGQTTYTSSIPFGYKKVDGKLVIVEEEARQIQRMYELRIAGMSLYKISDELGWSAHCIRLRIRNTVYRGVVHSNLIDEDVETPAIVDNATWCKANSTISRRPLKNINEDALLRRKIKCPECGCSYATGFFKGAGGVPTLSYRCTTPKKHEHAMSFGAVKLHAVLEELHERVLGSKAPIEKKKALNREVKRLANLIGTLREDIRKEIKRIEVLIDVETPEEIMARKQKIMKMKAEIKRLHELRKPLVMTTVPSNKWYDDIVRIEPEFISFSEKKLTIHWLGGTTTTILYRPRINVYDIIA